MAQQLPSRSAPKQTPKDQINADYVKTFNTPHGKRVLAHIEQRAYSAFRLDQEYNSKQSNQLNPAFMNPYAAMYRSAQIDVVQKIRRMLKTAGVDLGVLEEPEIRNLEET